MLLLLVCRENAVTSSRLKATYTYVPYIPIAFECVFACSIRNTVPLLQLIVHGADVCLYVCRVERRELITQIYFI